jgi:hypothetical protein
MADAGTGQEKEAPKERKQRRHWIEVSQVVAMPLVTLVVGYVLNSSLSTTQTRDSNLRLYADMMGRREEADSALRKDMFKSILDTFVAQSPGAKADPEAQVLNLELLAYNFHESLDLGPLFKHVQRQLTAATTAAGKPDPKDQSLLWRLERVAEEVKERQLAAIAESGSVERGELDVMKSGSGAWSLGRSALQTKAGEQRGGATLCLSYTSTDIGMGTLDATPTPHYRQFRVEFLDYAPDRREVELSLRVSKPLTRERCESLQEAAVERANLETEAQFWVGPFGFPMIDNTRLSRSERCSVSVIHILDNSVTVAISYFPASRASLKDKPYYDEVLQDLLRNPSGAPGK